jgi:hypothetical protein
MERVQNMARRMTENAGINRPCVMGKREQSGTR